MTETERETERERKMALVSAAKPDLAVRALPGALL